MFRKLCFFVFLFCFKITFAGDFLPAWQAFAVEVKNYDSNYLAIDFNIAKDYDIYQDKIKITQISNSKTQLGAIKFPDPIVLNNDTGRYLVYENHVQLLVPLIDYTSDEVIKVKINYQGCKGLELCYPEQEITKEIKLNTDGVAATHQTSSNQLFNHNFIITLVLFLFAGILISFTPCVLPMLPIIFSIIIHKDTTHKKAILLAMSYVLGGATTYMLGGIVAAIFGSNFTLLLQSAWTSYITAGLFVLFAFAMFGWFNLQIPHNIQNKLNNFSSNVKSQSIIGVFIGGAIANLVLSPCITAPFAGALIYIAQSKDVLLGASALFMLGLGSGLPLVLLAVFGKKILPQTGNWMNVVKELLGFALLALAVYMLSKAVDWWIIQILILFMLVLFIGYMIVKLTKRYLLAIIIGVIVFVVGLVSGYYLQNKTDDATVQVYSLVVDNSTGLDKAITESTKPVILDFSASWCIACKEFEHNVLSDASVQEKLKNYTLIKVDITDQKSVEVKKLMQRYNVFAPPTLVFLDKNKQVVDSVVGNVSKEEFVKKLH